MWQEAYKDDGKVKLHNTDTEGAIESVRINGVSVFRENIRDFFPQGQQTVRNNEVSVLSGLNLGKTVRVFSPQGQSKLSVIMRCPY